MKVKRLRLKRNVKNVLLFLIEIVLYFVLSRVGEYAMANKLIGYIVCAGWFYEVIIFPLLLEINNLDWNK